LVIYLHDILRMHGTMNIKKPSLLFSGNRLDLSPEVKWPGMKLATLIYCIIGQKYRAVLMNT